MNSVGILGFGRFGQLLAKIFADLSLKIYDPSLHEKNVLTEVLQQKTLLVAVPIRAFESVIKDIAPQLQPGTTVIDVCSVKVYPVKMMLQYLDPQVDIIATHPLFGPDSFYSTSHTKKIMMASVRDRQQKFSFWKDFFSKQNIIIEEMTPEEHDQIMARSQGITHLIGRALARIDAKSTPINTAGYSQLLHIMQHTCNDSWELFCDLQHYNPYSQVENRKLLQALKELIDFF